jgi:endonuclease-3 related protein
MLQNASSRPECALRDFYGAVREHFGYTGTWWPGSPIELTITAILVQQCDWSVAWAGVGRLRERGLVDLESLSQADPEEVKSCIQPVSFAVTKAERLVSLSGRLVGKGFATIESLLDAESTDRCRQNLLDLPGIGPETADCILLFASDRHETFVVDAYTRRIFQRLNLFPAIAQDFWDKPYEMLRAFFFERIAGYSTLYEGFEFAPRVSPVVALLRDFHSQIVELGRHHCLKTSPRCWSPGKAGWKDYFFCRGHCSNNGCLGCPLVKICRRRTLPATSERLKSEAVRS